MAGSARFAQHHRRSQAEAGQENGRQEHGPGGKCPFGNDPYPGSVNWGSRLTRPFLIQGVSRKPKRLEAAPKSLKKLSEPDSTTQQGRCHAGPRRYGQPIVTHAHRHPCEVASGQGALQFLTFAGRTSAARCSPESQPCVASPHAVTQCYSPSVPTCTLQNQPAVAPSSTPGAQCGQSA